MTRIALVASFVWTNAWPTNVPKVAFGTVFLTVCDYDVALDDDVVFLGVEVVCEQPDKIKIAASSR